MRTDWRLSPLISGTDSRSATSWTRRSDRRPAEGKRRQSPGVVVPGRVESIHVGLNAVRLRRLAVRLGFLPVPRSSPEVVGGFPLGRTVIALVRPSIAVPGASIPRPSRAVPLHPTHGSLQGAVCRRSLRWLTVPGHGRSMAQGPGIRHGPKEG
jgi:hypothetical protein